MKAKLLFPFSKRRLLLGSASFIFILCVLNCPLWGQEDGFFANPVGVQDEFGISITPTEANLAFPTLVDIDGDNDLDLFYSSREFNLASYCWETTAFEYYKNEGSDDCPEFVKQEGAPFGLPNNIAVTQFVDIDDDGDLDLFTSDHCTESTISYFENTGSAMAPAFSNIPTLSFLITGISYSMVAFGDLDNDGDYDCLINGIRPGVFKYLENTGTPQQFQFTIPVDNPFGLEVPPPNGSEWSLFADWDCDGDLDVLNSHLLLGSGHNTWLVYYHENTGTPEAPNFLPPIFTGDTLVVSTLGDLDGDGDLDILSDEYFYKNISQPKNCVTQPVAGFSYWHDSQIDLTVAFVNESTAMATDCREVKWRWDFGDQTGSQEENPVHTYSEAGFYPVRLIVDDVAGSDTLEQTIDVTFGLGVESIQNFFVFYPNPATDFLYLEPKKGNSLSDGRIEIYDAIGQRVRSQQLDLGSSIRVNVKGLPAGNYLLKIRANDRLFIEQFIKTGRP